MAEPYWIGSYNLCRAQQKGFCSGRSGRWSFNSLGTDHYLARMKLAVCLWVACCMLQGSSAKSVLGFACPGATSHQAGFATVGLELIKRGHRFTLLMSSGDIHGQTRLARDPFHKIPKLNFSGSPDVGTEAWLRQVKRDPQKVRGPFTARMFECALQLLLLDFNPALQASSTHTHTLTKFAICYLLMFA